MAETITMGELMYYLIVDGAVIEESFETYAEAAVAADSYPGDVSISIEIQKV